MSGGDTAKSSWKASGPNRTARERSTRTILSGVLAELVKADLRCRFDQGQTPDGPGISRAVPRAARRGQPVLSLVYEEFCLDEERGSAPDVESFCDRYPEWKSSLVSQLQYHRLFSQAAGCKPTLPRFPEAGRGLRGIPPAVAAG